MPHENNPFAVFSRLDHRAIGPVSLDVVINEVERFSAAITEHPVEIPRGATNPRGTISDHVFLLPKTYTMRGAVSDMPITWQHFTGYANSSKQTRSISAYNLLVDHFENRETFELHTGFALHENMLIESLTFPRDASTSNVIVFTAEIREVQIVTPKKVVSGMTAESVSGDQAKAGAPDTLNRGEVAPKEVSVGSQLFNAARAALGAGG